MESSSSSSSSSSSMHGLRCSSADSDAVSARTISSASSYATTIAGEYR